MEESVDLTGFEDYTPSLPGYRHANRASVGWLDGHVSPHLKSFVTEQADTESGWRLRGNERLIHWNLY